MSFLQTIHANPIFKIVYTKYPFVYIHSSRSILSSENLRFYRQFPDEIQRPAHGEAENDVDDREAPADYETDMSAPAEFDVSSMKKTKITKEMSQTMTTNRNIDDLMNQMEETFSQRLLRMIDERGLTDSEVYTKAYVDRRHFSKIRKDINYAPNKKTVLAFTIALELSLDEAKDLLRSAGFALSRSSKTDIIVAYFLQNKIYDMFEINDVLYAYGQPVFG